MKKKIILSITIVCLIAAAILILLLFKNKSKNTNKTVQFAGVEKGEIKTTISATGSIEAWKTVEVGTQVSGTIAKIYVDYNNRVKKGQLLAQLDTTLLDIAVQSANADLLKANAQYELAEKEYQNNIELNKNKLVSDFELDKLRVAKDSSYATKLSAEISLKRARTNFLYAIIRSPIDGTIIEKNIEEGQTVAASLSSPTLFTIAEDLSNIQIKALVPESDIGNIKTDQNASFTVSAYSSEIFNARVREVHLKPTLESNVVNYTVVLAAKNKKNMLLPGMTATVDFIIEEKKDVFLISNAALRFKPQDSFLKENNIELPAVKTAPGRNKNNDGKNNKLTKDRSKNLEKTIMQKTISYLWYYDESSKLKYLAVETGITDGQKTEISASALKPGMKFISSISSGSIGSKSGSQNMRIPGRMF